MLLFYCLFLMCLSLVLLYSQRWEGSQCKLISIGIVIMKIKDYHINAFILNIRCNRKYIWQFAVVISFCNSLQTFMTLIYTNFFFTYQILKSLKDILKYLFFFLEMIFSIVCLSCGLNSQSKEFSVSTTIFKKNS